MFSKVCGPVRADGVTAESPSQDRTTKYVPFSSYNPQDGGPYDLRQIGVGAVGDRRRLRGKGFAQPKNFTFEAELGICVKEIKGRVLFYSNHWREWALISKVSLPTSNKLSEVDNI